MKLIGSKIEKLIEDSLKESKKLLFQDETEIVWKNELMKLDPNLKTAYELDNIPEQGEDIRTFITDKKEIYIIEISRVDPDALAIVEKINFHKYKRGLRGKHYNLKLIIALNLIDEDLKIHCK